MRSRLVALIVQLAAACIHQFYARIGIEYAPTAADKCRKTVLEEEMRIRMHFQAGRGRDLFPCAFETF